MNYLAHVYLSGTEDEVIVGNFIGDFVKGHELNRYSEKIRKGIMLHRYIDSFTDTNIIVKRSKSRIIEKYHKYSGIIIDIFYDHFLVKCWDEYSTEPLSQYVPRVHAIMTHYYEVLPTGVQLFLPSFIKNNWISKYSTIEGIEEVLHRMSSRTTLPEETDYAIKVLRTDYDKFISEFSAFFPAIINYVIKTFGVNLITERFPRMSD